MKKINLIVFVASFLFLTNSVFAQAVLFVGDGCPHCANVEEYFTENKVREKFDIKIFEIFNHPENQVIYEQETKKVGYDGGGVPVLVVDNTYIAGDVPIINYYDEKLKTYTATSVTKTETQDAAKNNIDSQENPTTLTEEELNDMKDLASEEDLTAEIVDNSPQSDNQWGFLYGNNKYYYTLGGVLLMTVLGLGIYFRKKK
jgi:glutaredoxin